MNLKYTVDKDASGKTVKHILKSKLELSERLIKKLKYQGKILCNNEPVYVNASVYENDIIEVDLDYEESCEMIIPEDIPIDIIHEDESIIVLNKQPGIVVHPTSGHPSGTLANAITYHLNKKGIVKKVRPVIRLDRGTSGIIIFAMNSFSQEFLIKQMNKKTFLKEYIGIAHGIVKETSGTLNLPIARKPGSIMIRHIAPDGDPSVTHYNVIEYLNNATVLKFRLETGRTHQIRVHCQAIDHPLVGDSLYPYLDISRDSDYDRQISEFISDNKNNLIIPGNEYDITHENSTLQKPEILGRQALHSCRVTFMHPATRKILELTAPVPEDMEKAVEILRK